jgi:hypothetical protein
MTTWLLGLTILFYHVFVDTSRSQGCKKTTCQNEKIKGQNRARKGKEKTPSDEPTVPFLVASDELQRKSSEYSSTGWSDGLNGDTVDLSDAQFEFIQRRAKTKPSAPDDPTPWSRWSVGLSDGRVKANRGDLGARSSAPDDPTHRRCIASEQLCQKTSTAMWRGRGTGWTDALEKHSIGSSDATFFSSF